MATPNKRTLHIFLSYSHRDSAFVERLRADILGAGLPVWIDYDGLQPGTDNWEKAIRAAIERAEAIVYVASENAYQSDYCQSELAVARAYGRKIYPVFARGDEFVNCIPMGMTHVQYVDMRDEVRYTAGLPSLLKALGVQQARPVEALPAAEPEIVPVPPDFTPTNPYKGLEPFTAEDRANFFGRSTLVRTLVESVENMTTERFLAIVGPSGAGKSSVVMAGMLPTLRDHHPDWLFLPRVVPGDRPLEALAIALRAQFGGAISDYERDLRESDMRGLVKHSKGSTTKPAQRVVLFVDQFEELFTQTPLERESERRQFIDLLITAALDPKAPVVIVLTLRADFTDRALAYDSLTQLMQHHTQLIPPLSLADLREVVEEPARCQHLTFDPDLAADLVFAVRDQAGALPLLQFTLDQLYQRHDGLKLTRAAYNAIGGLRGALAKHAEAAYAALPSETHRTVTRWLFLRLIEPGATDQEITRRRVARLDLVPDNPGEASIAGEVIDAFIAARLLTGGEKETVEVAHEALLREWPTLVEWLKGARTDLPTQKALVTATAEWLNAGAKLDDERLAGPVRLREFTEWAARNRLSADEAAFLRASRARQADLFAQEKRRKQEMRDLENSSKVAAEHAQFQARRASRRTAIALAVIGLAVVVGLAAAILIANAQRDTVQANKKADSAQSTVGAANATLTQVPQTLAAANAQVTMAQVQVIAAHATLTPVPLTIAAANAQVVAAGQTVTPIPVTLTAVAYKVEASSLAAASITELSKDGGNAELAALLAIRSLKKGYVGAADAALQKALDRLYTRQVIPFSHGITAVAFSPDGKYVLTGEQDPVAKLWDVQALASGKLAQPLRTFSGHTGDVSSVAYAPDGKTILTGSDDKTARLWDMASGQTLRTFSGHNSVVTSVAFAPDGKTILTGGGDNTARLWDMASGQPLRIFSGHTGIVRSAAYAPDGRTILTGSDDNTAWLWDVTSGQPLRAFSGHTDRVYSVAYAPDGKAILTGSQDNTARLWDVESGQSLRTFSGHTGIVWSVAFAPDGKTILTGSSDNTARLWDVESGQSLRTFSGHTSSVWSVAYAPDGKTILTGSGDKTVRLWDMASGQFLRTFSGHSAPVLSVAYAPDGKTILTESVDKTARLWDVASGQPLRTFSDAGGWSVAYAPDGKTILTGGGDNTARLWDMNSEQLLHTFSGHTDSVWSVVFAPDGKTILTGSSDKTARLWDVESGQSLRTFSGHTSSVTSVAFAPDGKTILTGSGDKTARLWDVASGQTLRTFKGHTNVVYSVAYAPDGKTILTGSSDNTARLWDVASGQTLRTFSGHTNVVYSVTYAPDGKTILTGSYDNTARLWDVASGQTLRTFSGHASNLYSVAFAPDGQTILTGSFDNTARLWDVDYRAMLVYACTHIYRDFGAPERQFYGIADQEPTCPQFGPANLPPTMTPFPIHAIPAYTAVPAYATAAAAYATAQRRAQQLDSLSGTQVYQQANGDLKHTAEGGYIVEQKALVSLVNFIVEVRFFNPYNTTKGTWDYGITFRETRDNRMCYIAVTSRRQWALACGPEYIDQGSIPNLEVREGSSNSMRLIVKGDVGLFFVNGELIDTLDVSDHQEAGTISVATGMFAGDAITGQITHFENFTIWSLDPATPTPTSSPSPTATVTPLTLIFPPTPTYEAVAPALAPTP